MPPLLFLLEAVNFAMLFFSIPWKHNDKNNVYLTNIASHPFPLLKQKKWTTQNSSTEFVDKVLNKFIHQEEYNEDEYVPTEKALYPTDAEAVK